MEHADWKKLFAAVAERNSDIDPETLSSRAMRALCEVIPGELMLFDFFYNNGVHTGQFWNDPPNAISESEYNILFNFVHEHPFTPSIFHGRTQDSYEDERFPSQRHSFIKARFIMSFTDFSGHHQLLSPIQVSEDVIVTCTQNRVHSDFTDAERQMVALLVPHLKNVIVNGRKIGRLFAAERSLNEALIGRSTGVLSLASTIGFCIPALWLKGFSILITANPI